MAWRQDPTDKRSIIDRQGNMICRCWDISDGEAILLEHNSHAALLAACRGLIALDVVDARETLDFGPGGTEYERLADELIHKREAAACDAIKLAEDQPCQPST